MKHGLYSVSERSVKRLVIARKTSRLIGQFVYSLLFVIAWFAGLLYGQQGATIDERILALLYNPFYWIFIFSGLWIIFSSGQTLYAILAHGPYVIDKAARVITLPDKKTSLAFDNIECIQIRKYTDSDNDTDYRLSIVKTDGSKLFIDRSSDREGVIEFAEEVADFINKPLVNK